MFPKPGIYNPSINGETPFLYGVNPNKIFVPINRTSPLKKIAFVAADFNHPGVSSLLQKMGGMSCVEESSYTMSIDRQEKFIFSDNNVELYGVSCPIDDLYYSQKLVFEAANFYVWIFNAKEFTANILNNFFSDMNARYGMKLHNKQHIVVLNKSDLLTQFEKQKITSDMKKFNFSYQNINLKEWIFLSTRIDENYSELKKFLGINSVSKRLFPFGAYGNEDL